MRRFIFPALLAVAALGLLIALPQTDAYGRGQMNPSAMIPPMPPMPPNPALSSDSAPQTSYGQYPTSYGQYPTSGYQMSTYQTPCCQMPSNQMQTYQTPGYQKSGSSYGENSKTPYRSVGLYDNLFDPDSITVPVGTIVVWKNYGQHHHTVTSDDGTWGSGELGPGSMYAYTFTLPGTYHYYCQMHMREMRGTIVVR